MLHTLPSVCIMVNGTIATIKSGTTPGTSPDLTSNPLANLIIGVLIGAIPTLISLIVNVRQQSKRDKEAAMLQDKRDDKIYAQQKEREQIAFEQQLKREQLAYGRTVKVAKRERLFRAYKVILNAAEEYKALIPQLKAVLEGETVETRNQRLNTSLVKALEGINEAMIDITLEGTSSEVKTIFDEQRTASTSYISMLGYNVEYSGSFSYDEFTKAEKTVIEKLGEITTVMQNHLKELES